MSEGTVESAAGRPVRFVLFGGVRIVREGTAVEVTQPKQRGLLGLLMSAAGESVSTAFLIDMLWPGEPAASVTNQIHRHVGALRRLCEPSLERRAAGRYVLPAGNGYRLAVVESESDVLRFRRHVRDAQEQSHLGDRHRALASYVTALGVAAAPAGDSGLARLPTFVALEDERVAAINAAVGLCERGEDFSALLPVIRAATALHRLDENLHAALMDALSGTGRTGEALEVFAQMRATLAQELGSSPGAALRAAQGRALAIEDAGDLQHDRLSPESRPGAVVPAQLPVPVAGFAGRHDVLAALQDGADGDGGADGNPRVLLITGMAGVGKTTLALRHAAQLASRYPDGQLYVNLRGFDTAPAPTDVADALRDMLEGLGTAAPAQPQSIDARAGLLRTTLSQRRVLVVLDNARDYHQIEPLLPGTGDSRVIVTSRNHMPALTAFHQSATIQLDPFDDGEVVEFFDKRIPRHRADDTAAMIDIGRACGGLPLALAIVSARAAANPDFPLDLLAREFAAQQSPLAALNAGAAELDLRTVFSWSLRALSVDAGHTFAAISVHPGPEISLASAASMAGLDLARTHDALVELTLANAVREARPGRYVFHDLVRTYAQGLLGRDAGRVRARLINHHVRSTREAILTFGRPAMAPIDEQMSSISTETFDSSSAAMRWYATERRVLHQVCRTAAALGDHRSAVMLILDWRPMSQALDSVWEMFPFATLAAHTVEQHPELFPEPGLRAEAYRNAATSHAHVEQLEQAHRYFDLAAAEFTRSDDLAGLANLERNIGMTLPMSHEARIQHLRAAVDMSRNVDNRTILLTNLQALVAAQNWAHDYENALTTVEDAARVLAAIPGGVPSMDVHISCNRAIALAGIGLLQQAADAADHALPMIRGEGELGAERGLLISHGDVLTALGRRHEAAQVWQRLLSLISGPDDARQLLVPGDHTSGAEVIDRIERKLAALGDATHPEHLDPPVPALGVVTREVVDGAPG